MNSNLQCSICLKKNNYKSELQQYDCKFCLTKDLESNQDKLICKDCMKKINQDENLGKCPFCNSSVKSGEKIDVYRTPTGVVVNNIIVKRKSCIRSCKNFLCKDIEKFDYNDVCLIIITSIKMILFVFSIGLISITVSMFMCHQIKCYLCYVCTFLSMITSYTFFLKLFGLIKDKYIFKFQIIWTFLTSLYYTILIGIRDECTYDFGILPLFIIYFAIFYYIINKTDLNSCD